MIYPTLARVLAFYVLALALFATNSSLAAESEASLKAAIAKIEAKEGRQNLRVAKLLNELGMVYWEKGRLPEAEVVYSESLAIRQKLLPPAHRDLIEALGALGAANLYLGRYQRAEDFLSKSLVMANKILDPFDEHIADILVNLAGIYLTMERHTEAEQACKRSININEKTRGPNHPNIGKCMSALGASYEAQRRYAEAEEMYKKSLAFRQKNQGATHPAVAIALGNLAGLYQAQGQNQHALSMHEKAFLIQKSALGSEHPDTIRTQLTLGSLQLTLGREAEGERTIRAALPFCESRAWQESDICISSYIALSGMFISRGRFEDAEALLKRGIALGTGSLGESHRMVADFNSLLATVYKLQGKKEEALVLASQALGIQSAGVGPEHHRFAEVLSERAEGMMEAKRFAEAIPILEQALALNQKLLGNKSNNVVSNLRNLATCYFEVGNYRQAEQALVQVLSISEQTLGPDSRHAAYAHFALVTFNLKLGKSVDALKHIQIASKSLRKVVLLNQETSLGTELAQGPLRSTFSSHLSLLGVFSSRDGFNNSLLEESFDLAQVMRISSTGQAVAQMAARFASGSDAIAKVVRQRQDIADRQRTLDGAFIKALGAPLSERNVKQEHSLRTELVKADEKLKALDQQIDRDYPAYRELTRPNPLTIAETQKLLQPDEALLVYVVDNAKSYLWLVRKNAARFIQIPRTADSLKDSVQIIRQSLDLSGVRQADEIKPFDTKEATELYQALWQAISAELAGVRHVFVVPDGPLQSLPFGVLLESLPKAGVQRFSDYRNLAWLGKRYALSTLPSVNSLRALRLFPKRQAINEQPFIGFGDPLLTGVTETNRGGSVAKLFSRGAVADVDTVRNLPRLADTADELLAQSRIFKSGGDSVFLREKNTESTIKRLDLTKYRVLSFATHGLLAGELKGVAEPALVFTPPKQGSALDDGLLTASEVAQLKLNADWVVMSACNTAGPSGEPGAEGLSGLAKAFFYAGGRSLLVSHWPVSSEATVTLMTDIFSIYSANPKQGKAETVRLAMVRFMQNDKHAYFAHPAFWAPFVLVGEGGVDARR